MSRTLHFLNIPAESQLLNEVQGKHFEASIYQLSDGSFAALVEIDPNAEDDQLAAERMNSRIRDAAHPHTLQGYSVRFRAPRQHSP